MNALTRSSLLPLPLRPFPSEMQTLVEQLLGPRPGVTPLTMALDIEETDNEFVITAEMAGVDPKDVNLNIDGREVTLTAERKKTSGEKKPGCVLEEIEYGKLVRRILLPAEVVAEKTTADYKAGMLRIVAPKATTGRGRKIEIHMAKG